MVRTSEVNRVHDVFDLDAIVPKCFISAIAREVPDHRFHLFVVLVPDQNSRSWTNEHLDALTEERKGNFARLLLRTHEAGRDDLGKNALDVTFDEDINKAHKDVYAFFGFPPFERTTASIEQLAMKLGVRRQFS